MNIVDWFDIKNKDHLRAYSYWLDHGYWPLGFVVENGLEFSNGWNTAIVRKMVNAYLKLEGIEEIEDAESQ